MTDSRRSNEDCVRKNDISRHGPARMLERPIPRCRPGGAGTATETVVLNFFQRSDGRKT